MSSLPSLKTGSYVTNNKLPVTLNKAHEIIAQVCREDIFEFGRFVFGYDAAPHHREWLRLFLNPDESRVLIISPRESAKTTWMCTILFTWYLGHNPHTTNAILSVTEDQAVSRLMTIRDIIANNPRYKLVFPWVLPDTRKKWTTKAFNLWDLRRAPGKTLAEKYKQWTAWEANNKDSLKDHTLRAAGAGSGVIIGNRFTGIALLDDIHDEKNTNTREQIDKVDTWFHRTVLPCLRPQSKALIIGTRWSPEDLLGRLMEKKHIEEILIEKPEPRIHRIETPIWKFIETKAITYDDDGTPHSYWDDNWSLTRLAATKEDVGDVIFELMYMNNPFGMMGDLFKPEWLETSLPSKLPDFKHLVIGVDPAFTQNARSDNTAMVLLGLTGDHRVFNLGMEVGRFAKPMLIAKLHQLYEESIEKYGRCDRIYVEKVGAQAFFVDQLIEETALPIEGVNITNKGDKVQRAQPFSMVCARQHYFCDFTTKVGRKHKGELLSFPDAPKDDTVDAVTLVINRLIGARGTLNPKFHKIRPKFVL